MIQVRVGKQDVFNRSQLFPREREAKAARVDGDRAVQEERRQRLDLRCVAAGGGEQLHLKGHTQAMLSDKWGRWQFFTQMLVYRAEHTGPCYVFF